REFFDAFAKIAAAGVTKEPRILLDNRKLLINPADVKALVVTHATERLQGRYSTLYRFHFRGQGGTLEVETADCNHRLYQAYRDYLLNPRADLAIGIYSHEIRSVAVDFREVTALEVEDVQQSPTPRGVTEVKPKS